MILSQIELFKPEQMPSNDMKLIAPTSAPTNGNTTVSRSTFYQGDCLVEMDKIADKSVDMILCDLPYGTTACKWDSVIPFVPLWKQYERIIKDNCAIVLLSQEPFTSYLLISNVKKYRHKRIWVKDKCPNFLQAANQPKRLHEDILVFSVGTFGYQSKNKCTYNPIMNKRDLEKNPTNDNKLMSERMAEKVGTKNIRTKFKSDEKYNGNFTYPSDINYFPIDINNLYHPTQKPVSLMEYLIKTYTNEGETVLDNCMGSGTTGVACRNTNRHFIGIEKDEKYFNIAVSRVSAYCG